MRGDRERSAACTIGWKQAICGHNPRASRDQCLHSSGTNKMVLTSDLEKMAVADWLQSFNSVHGPIETLGVM